MQARNKGVIGLMGITNPLVNGQNQLSLRPALRHWERSNLKILHWDCFIRGLIRNDT